MNLIQFHQELMGTAPDDAQRALYRAKSSGFLDGGLDRKRFLAVLLLALWRARPEDGETFRKVLLIIPPTHERWAMETISTMARFVLGRLSDRPLLYNLVVKALQQLQVGSRILGLEEPAIWVSYGFGEQDTVPSWLRNNLLRV